MVVVLMEAMNARTPSAQAAGVVLVVDTLAFITTRLYLKRLLAFSGPLLRRYFVGPLLFLAEI
jgi:uncharacterized membrane protein YGL010W